MCVKAWGPVWALLGLVALIAFGLFQYGIPNNKSRPTPTPSQYQQATNSTAKLTGSPNKTKGNKEQAANEPFWAKPTDILLVIFNGLLALFTWRLYLATSGLFQETAGLRTATEQQSIDMKASTKAATDAAQAAITSNQIAVTNAEQQLRAYVTVQEIQMDTHRHPSTFAGTEFWRREFQGAIHTYEFTPVLRNGGQTPAINVVANVTLRQFPGGVPADFGFPDEGEHGGGVIGPQTEWYAPPQSANARIVNPDDTAPLLLWGAVEYDDIFSGSFRHRTEFCFQIDVKRVPVTGETWVGFIPYRRYNNVDGNCEADFDPHENKYH